MKINSITTSALAILNMAIVEFYQKIGRSMALEELLDSRVRELALRREARFKDQDRLKVTEEVPEFRSPHIVMLLGSILTLGQLVCTIRCPLTTYLQVA